MAKTAKTTGNTEINLNLHQDEVVDFLVKLLNIHSPTGYYREAMAFVRQEFEKIGTLELSGTRKGALLAKLPGKSSDHPIALTAHVDTLGLLVKEIKGDGRLSVSRLGGLTLNGSENENVTVRTYDDKRIRGTFAAVNPSSHVNPDIHRTERSEKSMEVRLDAKTTSRAETEALGIRVGDFVFLDPRVEVTETGFIKSRFLDDKASVACIYGALLALKAAKVKPPQDTYILIANYEEVGHGGAAGIPANVVELLSVDMGAIGDGQNSDEYSVSICVKDGGGPYHFDMNNKLRRLSEANNIAFKTDIYVYYSSDGTAFWRAGGDAKVGLAGPGIAASHSYERTHKDSLLHSTHLLARYMMEPIQV
ncbi:MAG TPA: M42 family metallopeptidase [Phototrophicaceae bacterium]|jgi:putative aminopeptidase FrvX|nr:M42 family metallopeptidase [Phototrophicaceae bacterium]